MQEAQPAGWYPSPSDYSGQWMSYWDGSDWTSIPARLATKNEQEEFEWPDPPPPPEVETLDSVSNVLIEDALLLGGFGYALVQKSACHLDFGEAEVTVAGWGASGPKNFSIPYVELTSLSIGGAGKVQEGGGFAGGGFGLEGFAIGATVAGLLNAMTTRHRIETVIGLQSRQGELVFLCTTIEPASLQLSLSRVRALVRQASNTAQASEPGVAAELSKLADLVERGFLDRDEFDRAKERLLK
jgi:hypothetical protein